MGPSDAGATRLVKDFSHRVKAVRRKLGIRDTSTRCSSRVMANRVCYRSVDEHGAELDVQIQKQRNKARRQAFLQTCGSSSPVPRKIVTDQLRGYPVAKAEVSELAI